MTQAAYSEVDSVRDIPSRAVTRVTLEFPIELHLELTKLLYGQKVLVTLAPDLGNRPYGIIEADPSGQQEEPAQGTPELPAVTGETGRAPLCTLACMLCKNENFYTWCLEMRLIPVTADESFAELHCKQAICNVCGIKSRKELDTDASAARIFHEQIRRPFAEWCHVNGVTA